MTPNQRILAIDDSPIVIEALRDALEEHGIEVAGVFDTAAIHHLRTLERFDLILMDVQMPAMFGDELAMIMRDGRELATPIVLMSSLPEAELATRAREAGVDGYISKQGGIESVAAQIRVWLAERERRRQKEA